MDAPREERLPTSLAGLRELGRVGEHACLEVERGIYVFWLVGHFRRADLDELTRLCTDACGLGTPYVSISLTERLGSYDPDLRTVMTAPGELATRRAKESVVVSERPLERMVVQTMSLAGRAAGSPGGALSTASTYEEALERARRAIGA